MKIIDILNAKESLMQLNKVKFNDFKIVSKVYKLSKQVQTVLDLVQQEQDKILDLYAKKDANNKPIIISGQYQFETIENRNKFIEEIGKLRNTECDEVEKIDISLQSIQVASELTSEQMLKLDPIINWID